MRLSADLGYSSVKLVYGRSRAEMRQAIYPAAAGPLESRTKNLSGRVEGGVTIPVDGDLYSAFVLPDSFTEFTRPLHEDYIRSKAYKALFLAALQTLGVDEVDEVVTGLPSRQALDPKMCQALTELMVGKHQVSAHHHVRVGRVRVVPQPVGAYVDYMARVGPESVRDSNVLVVDPGFGSVDWSAINRGNLNQLATGTSFQAMSVILEQAAKAINDDLGSRIAAERLEEALRNDAREVSIFRKPLNITPYIEAAAEKVVGKVMDEMLRQARTQTGQVDVVLLTGGGATFFAEAVKRTISGPDVEVAPEPVFANARGFFLASIQQQRRKAA